VTRRAEGETLGETNADAISTPLHPRKRRVVRKPRG
jgi:hypothetical protein